MFDDVFENKNVGATIITSAVGVVLILGCCCVKKIVYNQSKSKPKEARKRFDSHAIPSSKSAFRSVTPGDSTMGNEQ